MTEFIFVMEALGCHRTLAVSKHNIPNQAIRLMCLEL